MANDYGEHQPNPVAGYTPGTMKPAQNIQYVTATGTATVSSIRGDWNPTDDLIRKIVRQEVATQLASVFKKLSPEQIEAFLDD